MPASLPVLEQQRAAVLAQILELGDFRSGSITPVSGRCGKPNCRCHQPGQPGHGPNYRLTRKVNGKTVSETFSSGTELQKAQREVEAFHRFRELSRQLLEVNEKICQARPVEDSLTAQEKNGRSDPTRGGARDRRLVGSHLQWLPQERTIRFGSHRNGHPRRCTPARSKTAGGTIERVHRVRASRALFLRPASPVSRNTPKQFLTVLGPITIQRPYYLCPHCHQGHSPRDLELDVKGKEYSPGVRRMMAVVGSDTRFEHGREELELLAGLQVTTKAVERQAEAMGADIAQKEHAQTKRAKQLERPQVIGPAVPVLYIEMDGTQVPMVRSELEGRAGRVEGQPARTREVKLGCVFTQTTSNEQGRPVRDEASTTYTGAIESAEEFGHRLYTEAWERGWSRATKKVIIGDGAEWIWNIAEQHFPGAIQIVDLYHARQHLWELARALYPGQETKQKRWMMRQQSKLDGGKIEKVVRSLRGLETADPQLDDKLRTEAEYVERNAARMRYPQFRSQKLFVGSGVIEAACKVVIGSRLKQSGMFWTLRGANAIIALRCNRLSRKFEDYWASRSKAA